MVYILLAPGFEEMEALSPPTCCAGLVLRSP